MSTTIEAAARTRLDQPEIPDSERTFLERMLVLSEGQRKIDASGTFIEKATAAHELAKKGIGLLSEQLEQTSPQDSSGERIYRRNNPEEASFDNATFIRQDIAPFVDPLFSMFNLVAEWQTSESTGSIVYQLGILAASNSQGRYYAFPTDSDTLYDDMYDEFRVVDGDEILLESFACNTRLDIVNVFERAISKLDS